MTLPASGAITLAQVNTELGYPSTNGISLNDAAVRSLAGVPSGGISMSNLYGKTAPSTVRGSLSGGTAEVQTARSLSGGGTIFVQPTITASGGTSPYSYATTWVTQPTLPTSWILTSGTTTTPEVSVTYTQHAAFDVTGTLKTVITDHVGATYTINWTVEFQVSNS